MAEKSSDQIRSEFDDVVTMGSKELQEWLGTDESQSVGQSSGEGEESTGHVMGRRIVEILEKNKGDLDDDDLAAMKKVHGYVERHRKQEPSQEDITTSKWRYSLMNWGHDPLK
ncbi:DUF3140 domain-containing protein [Actinomycetospora aeridis]|uniref:DUF3140 domain-containing protein n=1 Tax=Actinomycetospora aeridis TaxID=3129231 RepID=A0ABU8NBR0_9PSEU